tara:strand:- start:4265 stop:4480 length:216 start_codon:yes stop_codon:yes gene_type:complete
MPITSLGGVASLGLAGYSSFRMLGDNFRGEGMALGRATATGLGGAVIVFVRADIVWQRGLHLRSKLEKVRK